MATTPEKLIAEDHLPDTIGTPETHQDDLQPHKIVNKVPAKSSHTTNENTQQEKVEEEHRDTSPNPYTNSKYHHHHDEMMSREDAAVPESLRTFVRETSELLNEKRASFDALWQSLDRPRASSQGRSMSNEFSSTSSATGELSGLNQISEHSSTTTPNPSSSKNSEDNTKHISSLLQQNQNNKTSFSDYTTVTTTTTTTTEDETEQLEVVSEDLYEAHALLHAKKSSFDALLEDYLENAKKEPNSTTTNDDDDDDEENSILVNPIHQGGEEQHNHDDDDDDDDIDVDSVALESLQADMNEINAQHERKKAELMNAIKTRTNDKTLHSKEEKNDISSLINDDIYNDDQNPSSMYFLEKRANMEECLDNCFNPCVIL